MSSNNRLSEDHDDNDDSVEEEFHNDDLPTATAAMARRKNNKRSTTVSNTNNNNTLHERRRYSKTPLIAVGIVIIFIIATVIRGAARNNNKPQPVTNINNTGALRTQTKEHHYTNPYEKSASGDGKEHTVKVINEKSSTGHVKSHGGWNEDEQEDDEENWSCRTDFPDNEAWISWMNHISRLGPQSACVRELKHRPCHCRQPLDPIARASTLWKQCLVRNQNLIKQQEQIEIAAAAAAASLSTSENGQELKEQPQQSQQLDVLMLGDSITEFWQGTKMSMIMPSLQATHQIYLDLFRNHHNNANNNNNGNNEYVNTPSPVSGLALGIAGDTCPQLLYRLQNNNELMLTTTTPPKVYWILIGINDYLSNACNAHVIAACNIKIVEYIQEQYRQNVGSNGSHNATIVINSMLPLGRLHSHAAFKEISQINQQLECYTQHHDNVYFFNAYEDFMTTSSTSTTKSIINASLLQDDGVHPSTLGYQVWGNAIVEYIQELKRLNKIAP